MCAGVAQPDDVASFRLGQLNRGGFGSLSPLDNADNNALTLVQVNEPCPLEHGGMDEDILATLIADDKAEPLYSIVPFHRPGLVDAHLKVRSRTC